jgi:polysaccharide biosynthesis protein VpsM
VQARTKAEDFLLNGVILLDNPAIFTKNIKAIMKKVLFAILLFSFCFPPIAFSAGISGQKTVVPARKLNRQVHRGGYLQRAAFGYRKNAKDLSRKLRRGGYKVFIVKGISSRGKKVYRVLAKKTRTGKAAVLHEVRNSTGGKRLVADKSGRNEDPALKPGATRYYASTAQVDSVRDSASAGRVRPPDISEGGGTELPKGAFLVSEAGDNGMPEKRPQEEGPVGTLRTYREIFGRGGSYFHPSFSVTELYTDNAFETKDNKKTNLSTILSPEIWLSLPRVTQKHIVLDDTSNRIPGGLVFTRLNPVVLRRYQAYFLYRADIPLPSANSPYRNTVSHTAYGNFTYNGNRFSADVLDQFQKSFETRAVSVSTRPGEVDKFYNNLFNVITYFNTGNRLLLRLDYSNFFIRYDDPGNSFRDRTDNSVAGYLFYHFKPKTAAFVEYQYIDISYDKDQTLNSREHHFLAGVQWDITAKSKGEVKAGYGTKDFTAFSGGGNNGAVIFEAQIKHQFTPRTSLTLTGYRKTDETNISTSSYTITNQAGAEYQQLLTSKITGLANLLYVNERYKGILTAEGNGSEIKDNIYQAAVGIQYEFQKWLRSSLGYVYTKRDSGFPDYNFSSNTFYFRITGSL